jgi:hypothetical protein
MQKSIYPQPMGSTQRVSESGNVLFLILIAVALFAALSYAVTQSSRSGGGDVSSEKSLVSSSELTQYPAGVRTSILHMIVTNSLSVNDLEFNTPSDFIGGGSAVINDTDPTVASVKQAVFHPAGGAGTYQNASAQLMAGGVGTWHFNQQNAIPGIGSSKNDMIAFLQGVNKSVCAQVDTQLGISTIPVATIPTVVSDQVSDGSSQVSPVIIPDPLSAAVTTPHNISATVTGQPFACVSDGGSPPTYTYYHVLIEQ